MDTKDKIDLLSKMAEIIYKKMIILLAAVGGSGSYAITQHSIFQIMLFVLFGFFSMGIVVNYFELNSIKKEMEDMRNE